MVTNITNLTGATNFYDIVKFTNTVTNGVMAAGFIVSVFLILTMLFIRKFPQIEKAILASSFICLLLSISLTAIGLLNAYYIIIFSVITSLDAFWVWFSTRV